MTKISGSDDESSALVHFTRSEETGQSAGSISDQKYDFLDFLGVAQSLKIDFLPTTWQPALDSVGEGGTAKIRQALINLQTSFAFKHFRHPNGQEQESQLWRALIAEISVLGSPTIRYHPNVVNIEGICWDVVSDEKKVWPVLVFEKTPYWDMNRFMLSNRGKKLDSRRRLDMLFDIALAIRDLHATGVIHGDIKPENVLVFSEYDDHYVAKVTDFGYSTLFTTESETIVMPAFSKLWKAPEWHHRGISPNQARKWDAYSFGLLGLWLLCYNKVAVREPNFKRDVEDQQQELSHHASELLEATDLEAWGKQNMQRVFRSTLAQDPVERTADFTDLLELLSPYRAMCLAPPADNISIPHSDFHISKSLHQLVDAHYGVRRNIAECLLERQDRRETSLCHTLNFAFCLELGFGIPGDSNRCRSLLDQYDIPVKDLESIIDRLERDPEPSVFQEGKFRTCLKDGHFAPLDFSQQYRKEQLSRDAESNYQREVETMRRKLGDGHYLVQQIRAQLSDLMVSEGRWKEAEDLQIRIMEFDGGRTNKAQYTGPFAADLAMIYSLRGRQKEAEELRQRIMNRDKRLLGSEHPYTLISMGNLAATYKDQKRWEEAEQLEAHVIQIYKKVFGTEHPLTLTNMNNISTTYSKQRRWTEAERLQTQVLETSQRILGLEHLDTLRCMTNLASTYGEQGRWEEAEDMLREVIKIQKSLLETNHPETLRSLNNLAWTYNKLQRWEEAEEIYLQVIGTGHTELGKEHPDILSSMTSLIRIYRGQERWKEVEDLQVQVVEMKRKVHGTDNPGTLSTMINLAAVYEKQGRWKESETLLMEVMETRKKTLGVNDPDTLSSMIRLAGLYWRQGQCEDTKKSELREQWRKAEELEEDVVATKKKVLGATHLETLVSMNDLAMRYLDQGRRHETKGPAKQEWLKKAEDLQVQVLEARKTVRGTVHLDTLISIIDLIDIYKEQNRRKDVDDLHLQVTEIEEGLEQLLENGRGAEGGLTPLNQG